MRVRLGVESAAGHADGAECNGECAEESSHEGWMCLVLVALRGFGAVNAVRDRLGYEETRPSFS
jgi:hypothetical protein